MAAPQRSTRDDERRSTDSNLPIPDPTRLTTQLVDRTISGFREIYDARLTEMGKAIALAANQASKLSQDDAARRDQLRADVDRQMTALREFIMGQIEITRKVNKAKFEAINIRFAERDIRTEQAAQGSQMSLDSAMAAAKEAVLEQNKSNVQAITKADAATQKQIDAMVQLMTTSNKSLEDKIADLKGRLDRGEGRNTGSIEARDEKRFDVGAILQALAVVAAVVGLILVAFHKNA